MPLEGRGNYYTSKRGAMEWSLIRLFRGGWPASLVHVIGMQSRVRTIEHRNKCPGWPEGRPPLRCGFVSDLHAGPTTHPSLLEEAFASLERAKPDLLLLGGDYVF